MTISEYGVYHVSVRYEWVGYMILLDLSEITKTRTKTEEDKKTFLDQETNHKTFNNILIRNK